MNNEMQMQALEKIAKMDNNLKVKLKEREWQEEIEYLQNQVCRQNFLHLADTWLTNEQ